MIAAFTIHTQLYFNYDFLFNCTHDGGAGLIVNDDPDLNLSLVGLCLMSVFGWDSTSGFHLDCLKVVDLFIFIITVNQFNLFVFLS